MTSLRSGHVLFKDQPIGPCAAGMVPCPHTVKDRNGHCDICCGSGRVTKWVRDNLAKAAGSHPSSPEAEGRLNIDL